MSKIKPKKRMKVIRTVEAFYPFVSGVANQAYNISKRMEEKGIKSPILTSNYRAEKNPKNEKIRGIEVHRFPIKWNIMKYFYTPEIKTGFLEFDLVHAHNHRSYQTETAFQIAKKQGKPFVISVHGSLLGYDHFLKGIAKLPYIAYDLLRGKSIIKRADAVIVNSKEEYKDAIRYGVKESRLHLLPVGIDVEGYSPLKKDESILKILFVGRISRNRNVEPIINSASVLKKRRIPCKFIIVGGEEKSSETSKTGYLNELKSLAKRMKVTDMVEFKGPKYDDELKKYYRTADIFVYTSLSENFGQTMLEAGAAGLPLICTKVGIAPDLIQEGKNGFIVKGEPKEIAERIVSLLDREKREAFGRISRDIVSKKYDWDRIIAEYLKIYKSLVKT
jgi:glycosyltransferase involved in cell wall biosynthesis